MSFFIYDMTFLAVFCLALFIFLYSRRKNLKREGITYLYRTSIGLKIIDKVGKRYPGFLNFLSYFIIAFGYFAMVVMIYLLYVTLKVFIINPDFIRIVKIPPLAPLVPYLPQIFRADYLPMFYFTYWIIVIAVVGIVHEFSHGIFARLYNIKVKSTGFAFFGPFIGAFVEPDERQMSRAKKKKQLTILAAGTFSNAVLTILFFLMLWLFFSAIYSASGVIFNTYAYSYIDKNNISGFGSNLTINFDGGLKLTEAIANNQTYFIPQELISLIKTSSTYVLAYDDSPALRAGLNGIIISINNIKITNPASLAEELLKYNPEESVSIQTLNSATGETTIYQIKLGKNPEKNNTAYLGIATLKQETSMLGKIRTIFTFFKNPNVYYYPKAFPELTEFIYYLIWWLAFINLSVALANMLPAWIFDGGRFFYLSVLGIVKKEKTAKIIFKIMNYIILGVFLLLMLLWFLSYF